MKYGLEPGGMRPVFSPVIYYKMYTRYAEVRDWKIDILSHHVTGVGGLKEIIALVKGKGGLQPLKI